MDIKNNAQATGSLTIKVHLSQRIDAVDYRDNGLLIDWLVEHIRDYNYQNIEIVADNLKLDDFTYIPE
jgi:hypothetical protein